MEKIDLSTNSKKIQDLYNKVVRGDASTTYGIFSVDKNGVLDATVTGSGELSEFAEEFSDGQVQFGLARVTVPGSDVSKNLLLGWCPDNAPAKLRLSFATNFADVSKVLSGYHIQITARDSDDLDVDEFISRVGAAAGARYLIQSTSGGVANKMPAQTQVPSSTPAAKSSQLAGFIPKSTGKPVFSGIPKSTGKPVIPITPKPKPSGLIEKLTNNAEKDIDEWGGEKEIEERDFDKQPLENVPSAYKPTKVDIGELRKQKSDTVSSKPEGVQPPQKVEEIEPKSIGDKLQTFQHAANDGRLTSLPKPKVNHSVASRYVASASHGASFGSKPSFGTTLDKNDKLVGGLSRNFAAENGKTPAQLWAEKRGQYKEVQQEEKPAHEELLIEVHLDIQDRIKSLQINRADDINEDEQASTVDNGVVNASSSTPETILPKPVSEGFPVPPQRTLPPHSKTAEDDEEEEAVQDEEDDKEIIEDVELKQTAHNLPPLPARDDPKPESKSEEVPASTYEPDAKSKVVTAVAQFDYEKDEDNELEFNEGDVIVDIEFVDEEWWSGKNSKTNKSGLFPGSYVTLVDDEDSKPKAQPTAEEPKVSQAPTEGKTAVAEYDYVKDEDNEISFNEGDLIVEIDFVDEDWWSGKHKQTGNVGLFPANYVKLN